MSGAERFTDAPGDAGRAEFIARLTAGATHELRNVLAIVKESAGLVGDLVAAAEPGAAPDAERVLWAVSRIQLQVTRGTELSTSLNRIMHGLDRDREAVDLDDAVQHAARLSRRFARLRRREIETVDADRTQTVTTNALDLYRALVAAMEWCVGQVPENGAVLVGTDRWRDRPAVRLTGRSEGVGVAFHDVDGPEGEPVRTAAARVGGRVEVAGPESSLLLRFE